MVITKGIGGTRINMCKAVSVVMFVWAYAIGINLPPMLKVWSKYSPGTYPFVNPFKVNEFLYSYNINIFIVYAEGLLTTCSFDYLNDNPWDKSYVLFIFVTAYVVPLTMLVFCYTKIVSTVWAHEKSLKDQAKRMNVESLRASTNVRN